MNHTRIARFFCFTTAALLLLAALWYALYIFNVIAPHELGFTPVPALAFLLIAPLCY